jgi:inositol transport system ATP-binding protein
MEGIFKEFSGVTVLRDVKLSVARGEVQILSGIVQKDGGTISLKGEPVSIGTPREALTLGISMIHQELNPVRAMAVSENIFLGKEPCHRFTTVVDRKRQRAQTLELFREIGVPIDPDTKMADLSVAEMQLVEIVKAISSNSEIIIMDEPTSALSDREAGRLFDIIRELKAKGISIIYISHKMDEIFRICDTITVLRDGQYITTRPARELDHDTLVKLMVGREISQLFPTANATKGEISLEVEGLAKEGVFENISFKVRRGEILGVAGLMGAGRSEVLETIFGFRSADAGRIRINGRQVSIKSPADAIRHRLALITEDRQQTGLNLKASVKDNITLVDLKNFSRFGQVIDSKKENDAADAAIAELRIKTRNRNQIVRTLSGGNQQKVVLAKWLLNEPEIIILDEPTRGIDIGAKSEIYKIITQLAAAGKTIIMISSELEEIMGLCDRAIVLAHGRITAEFTRDAFSQEEILKAAMGHITPRAGQN